LVRSEASAARLPTDVQIVAGSVEDLEAVERGLEGADAAIYLAILGTQGASDADRAALRTLVGHLRGTRGPLIVTGGLGVYLGAQEPVVDEATSLEHVSPAQAWRVALEQELLASEAPVVIIRPAGVYARELRAPFCLRRIDEHRVLLARNQGRGDVLKHLPFAVRGRFRARERNRVRDVKRVVQAALSRHACESFL
jgi:uncharacterized protein YbjT (DUF2867 family)